MFNYYQNKNNLVFGLSSHNTIIVTNDIILFAHVADHIIF